MRTLKDIFAHVMPKLIEYLIRFAGVRNQAKLADKSGVDPTVLSRYKSAKNLPHENLHKLAEAAHLSVEQVAWILGHLLVKVFHGDRVALPPLPDEVHEPPAPYDEPSLAERLAKVIKLDFTGLEPDDMRRLTQSRQSLHTLCEQVQTAYDNEAASLKVLLTNLEDDHRAAGLRAGARK